MEKLQTQLIGKLLQRAFQQLEHVGKILAAAGCTFKDVVKCTCHLSDIHDFDRFNSVYASFFSGIRPARTTVQSTLWGGIKVEIDAVAKVK